MKIMLCQKGFTTRRKKSFTGPNMAWKMRDIFLFRGHAVMLKLCNIEHDTL